MEVLDPQQTALTNAEVYRLVLEKRKAYSAIPKGQRKSSALGTVIYETSTYLKETPAASQTDDQIKSFIKSIGPYKLTAAEILQLTNLRPTSAVEVQLIIEECEERLTEDQVSEIVELVASSFPVLNKTAESDQNTS